MDVNFDFSDLDQFVQDIENQTMARMDEVGKEAVDFAAKNGNYKDHTGNLRKSNSYVVTPEYLELDNTQEYASFVEAKGFDVLSNAALFAESEMNK